MLSVHVRDKGSALKEKKGKEEQKKKPPLRGKRVQLQRQSDPFEAVSANQEAVPAPHQPCHFSFPSFASWTPSVTQILSVESYQYEAASVRNTLFCLGCVNFSLH